MPRKTRERGADAVPPLDARFNEAAARCRGKPGGRRDLRPALRASMRPRPDAAENASSPNMGTVDFTLQ